MRRSKAPPRKESPGLYWFSVPGDRYWKRAFPGREAKERRKWFAACVRVQRGALRRGDKGLAHFAGNVGYGCYLLKMA